MFELEREIEAWRRRLETSAALTEEEVGELEDHLRTAVDALLVRGLDEERALARSLTTIKASPGGRPIAFCEPVR